MSSAHPGTPSANRHAPPAHASSTPQTEPASAASGLLLVGVVLALSIAVSGAFHRLVERPSIALGNSVCEILAARLGGKALRSTPPA